MTPAEQSARVKRLAAELGFDRCGIAPAAPIARADFFRDWLQRGHAGTMRYLHNHVDSRIDVRAWLPWAENVIVAAVNYRQADPPPPDDTPRGRVAMYARGEDYHVVVREKLDRLVARLRETIDAPFNARVCVDTSAIVERELAAAAGIGWIGKNTLVLHQDLGSYVFLGEIITDLRLAPDAPEPDHCGTCTRCLDACPTDAFPRAYAMDARRCISYLTIEHRRDDIAPGLAAEIDDWVFGCDVCQQVCPFNQDQPDTTEPRLRGTPHDAWPALDDIADWDHAAYRNYVRGTARDRAKHDMWQRNARIAARNRERRD